MKEFKKIYTTGQADIDKYLVTKPDLLKPWPDRRSRQLTYRYLIYNLEPEIYKQVLETNYSGDYDSIVNSYIQENTNKDSLREFIKDFPEYIVYNTSVVTIQDFTNSLIKNDIWTEELVKMLMKSPFSKETTVNYVWNLVSCTEDKELLRPLVKHPWRDVRHVLATCSLFLDQLIYDKSPVVATEACKKLYRGS